MDADQSLRKQCLQRADTGSNSEQKLLWRSWTEKGLRVDRLAERRMTVLFVALGVILLACVLYYVLQARASFDPNQQRPAAMNDTGSTPVAWFHRQHSGHPANNGARQQSHDNAGWSRG